MAALQRLGCHSAVDLEIVRPGTWSGLRSHLEAKPRGWFHLVHFDVHARYDAQTKQTSMAFISEGSARKRTWRAGGEVSCLLAQFGVKIVILNASRCTASKGIANTSLAEQIIRDGARVVVAMPYKILNGAAEILFTTFYRHLLSNTWDIAQALSAARHAMRGHPTREARFGMKVPVMDWVAPVLYHNAGTELDLKGEDGGDGQIKVSNKLKSSKAKIAIEEFLQSFGEKGAERAPLKLERHFSIGATVFPGNEMLGRDGDIFEMETRILMENNILRLQGVPGVGE
ncbi:hypothetical protein EX30DRAFT_123826 [Ascodesmis nigricans]|uniref:CHAT domain-containing protein n=1 Tax=Ascodesmis nigricans TaxID=341454 RepID=A0A4S2MP15_9PEZI|nr:hypothetical protein EX30DRAFT_123826 [Ascodesmis nigricans]